MCHEHCNVKCLNAFILTNYTQSMKMFLEMRFDMQGQSDPVTATMDQGRACPKNKKNKPKVELRAARRNVLLQRAWYYDQPHALHDQILYGFPTLDCFHSIVFK